MISRQGQLLIAGPDLVDPNFHQTVTLMIEHTEQGALGLTLNRPTDLTVKQAWARIGEANAADAEPHTPCHFTGRVHLGGPCPGPMMVLHSRPDFAQLEVLEGVYFTTEPEHIRYLLEHNTDPMRVYATHAGWGPGQLEAEVEHESWIATGAEPAEVFEAGQRQWFDLIHRINPSQAAIVANPALLEADPALN